MNGGPEDRWYAKIAVAAVIGCLAMTAVWATWLAVRWLIGRLF